MIQVKQRVKRIIKQHPLGSVAWEATAFVQAKRSNHFRMSHPPGHYYSPIPSATDIKRPRWTDDCPTSIPGIDINEDSQLALAAKLGAFSPEMPFTGHAQTELRYYLSNEMFGWADGLVLYAILRHFEPKRVIEVGSGFSSALMLDVNDRWLQGESQFTFIEPYPDRLNELLRPEERQRIHLLAQAVQDVDTTVFDQLHSGDILFIDSSHVSKMGSDVNYLLFEVLPRLSVGVIVHFHDVFWPFEYPKAWANEGRAWNEDYLLRAFLSYNDLFEILLFNNWLGRVHSDAATSLFPQWSGSPGSLWLRVRNSS